MNRPLAILAVSCTLVVAACVPDPAVGPPASTTTIPTTTTMAPPIETTTYEVRTGLIGEGSRVRLRNLLVTAVSPSTNSVFAGVAPAAAGTVGGHWSAIEIDLGVLLTPAVGDRIDVLGVTRAFAVVAASIDVVSAGNLVQPYLLPELATPSSGSLDGVFVTTGPTSVLSHSEVPPLWTLANGFAVARPLIGDLPPIADGSTVVSISGIASTQGTVLAMRPRDAGDIG